MKNAGFEAYDFTMTLNTPECYIFDEDYREKAFALRKEADEIGIVCNQAHSPFPTKCPPDKGYTEALCKQIAAGLRRPFPTAGEQEKEYNELIELLICRSIEISGILGARNCVVHPFNYFTPERNAEVYALYEETARRAGVRIAVENMWNWDAEKGHCSPAACSDPDSFIRHLQLLDKEVFVACLDVGHAELKGLNTTAPEMIYALKDRLACLHLHDNDRWRDKHDLPYANDIDFSAVIDALANIGYDGDITFEAESFIPRFEVEFYPQAAKFMYEVGEYIRKKIVEKR